MIALIQRVSEARVEAEGKIIGEIGRGILALIGVERGDTETQVERLVEKVLGYRIFPDDAGKMNLSLLDIRGELLAVPQSRWPQIRNQGRGQVFLQPPRPRKGRDCSIGLFFFQIKRT